MMKNKLPKESDVVNKKRLRWQWPRFTVDLSNPRHRRKLFIGLVVFGILASTFLAANLKLYEYTESAEFCGEICHPMGPEIIRYELSPHAKVECVECHIGPGTSFFVKSKIDGIKQVIAVLMDNYARPIISPVHDLRPARDTCETCHSPTSFNDNMIKTILHFDNDEENTPIQSTLILKMGGWQGSTGISQGIHWHISNEIYYITADDQRQVMLWVGVKQPDGTIKDYYARDMLTMAQTSFVEQAWDEEKVRIMDCIDCHNRTAHHIPSPPEVVDDAIESGLISRDIPFIRSAAVEVLTPSYQSTTDAYTVINGLVDFYNVRYPNLMAQASLDGSTEQQKSPESLLPQAITEIKKIYDTTNFPSMGLNWQTNPNNERHTPTLGCFRCHDGKHVSIDQDGAETDIISVKCNLCHTVPIIGRGDELLVESPVITGATPESHADFRWTIEHRTTTETEEQECFQCHGQGFCSNDACHNLSHPPDMLYTHADEYEKRGNQVCYTCHQNILCSRCHPGGIVNTP